MQKRHNDQEPVRIVLKTVDIDEVTTAANSSCATSSVYLLRLCWVSVMTKLTRMSRLFCTHNGSKLHSCTLTWQALRCSANHSKLEQSRQCNLLSTASHSKRNVTNAPWVAQYSRAQRCPLWADQKTYRLYGILAHAALTSRSP